VIAVVEVAVAAHAGGMTSQRVAIVTGGSRGIGRAVVRRLAADGYKVVVNYAGNKVEAEAAVEEVGAENAIAVQADVADEAAVVGLFAASRERFGGVDAVIHAAGRMDLAPLATFDLDVLDEQVRVNVRGTFVVSQQAVQQLRDGGTLINFSSSVIGLAIPTYSISAATKGAVEAMTLILARELRGRDITVNVVAPGPTATDLYLDGKDQETIDRAAQAPPLQRLGVPDDIARVVSFLAGPDGRWVNGQVLRANGGVV
jgi:3-oxoacyl-[acyl-carrier protein] reductase